MRAKYKVLTSHKNELLQKVLYLLLSFLCIKESNGADRFYIYE